MAATAARPLFSGARSCPEPSHLDQIARWIGRMFTVLIRVVLQHLGGARSGVAIAMSELTRGDLP